MNTTTEKVKHTPWAQGLVDPLTIVNASGSVIVEISPDFVHHKGRALAGQYARLISAAPEMAEALEALLRALTPNADFRGDTGWSRPMELRSAVIAASAAIRKAKGEL